MIVSCIGFGVEAEKNDKEKESFSISDLKLKKVGRVEMNTKSKNGIIAFRNGVDIVIYGETPEENISIKADTILFDYASKDDEEPVALKLSGNVVIEIEGMKLECKQGNIDLITQIARFFDISSIVSIQHEIALEAEEVEINMETGDVVLIEGKGLDEDTEEKVSAE